MLAVVAGRYTTTDSSLFGLRLLDAYSFAGSLFLQALKMLIVPLILSSIITGVVTAGDSGAMGRLGGKTLLYYLTTSALAILVGLMLVNGIAPGIVNGTPAKEILAFSGDAADVAARVQGHGVGDVAEIFLRMVPTNIVAAAANGQMLGLIFFGLLFGYFMSRIEGSPARVLREFWQGVFAVMMRMTDWVMRFAPIGVFALVARVVASTGIAAFMPLLSFFLTVLAALAIHFFVTLPLILLLVGRVNPLRISVNPAFLLSPNT